MVGYDSGKLAAARLRAATIQPFLAEVLFAMAPVARPGLGSFAVDERWRLLIDPARLDGWSVPEAASVLLHEVAHLVRDHAGRARALEVATSDRQRWNLATDAEINDDLLRDGVELPAGAIVPSSLSLPAGRAAEYYYAQLGGTDELPPSDDCGVGCHACDTGHGVPPETTSDEPSDGEPDGLRPFEQDLLRRKVAHEVMANAGTRPGRKPGGWERWASGVLEPQLDWRDLLRSALRSGVASMSGADDYTYMRPSRRRVPGVVLPRTISPVPAVAVVVDTSGSMSPAQLSEAWSEVSECLRLMGSNRRLVTVLANDVDATVVAASGTDVQLIGGGGTDLRKGIAAATRLHPRPGLIVVLTDGATPWPAEPPPCRVVVALLGTDATTPAWATTVKVPVGG
jgi:predicted metal-dependent peptidase